MKKAKSPANPGNLRVQAPVRLPLTGHQLLLPVLRTGTANLFLADPDTGDARNLTRDSSMNRYPAWSPDGRRIVFTSDRDGAHNVHVMNADGTDVRQLTHEAPPAICFLPTWSGSNLIAFGRDRAGQVEILVMDPDGSEQRTLGPGTDPCLAPDGRTIAFTQKFGEGYAAFVMNLDGRGVRQISHQENRIGAVMPTWSPDSRSLLYSEQVGDGLEIMVQEMRRGKPRQLTNLGQVSTSAAWSLDGKWISFRVTATPFWRSQAAYDQAMEQKETLRPVWVMAADGSDARVIEPLRYQCATDGSRAVWRPATQTGG